MEREVKKAAQMKMKILVPVELKLRYSCSFSVQLELEFLEILVVLERHVIILEILAGVELQLVFLTCFGELGGGD